MTAVEQLSSAAEHKRIQIKELTEVENRRSKLHHADLEENNNIGLCANGAGLPQTIPFLKSLCQEGNILR